MPQDRFKCKECGTTDSTKFTLFENVFRCNVCGAINPYYDDMHIHKHTHKHTYKHMHSGKIAVDGIATVENMLTNARDYLNSNKFDKALRLYKQVLDSDCKNHVAFWGCYCCEKRVAAYYHYRDKYGNSGPRVKAGILADLITRYAVKAVENAPESCALGYAAALSEDIQFVKDVVAGKYN